MFLSKADREALKAVYRLTTDDPVAHTGDLADALDISPGTATTTVKRLADRGLLEHVPYRGVGADRRRAGSHAVAAIRRHRIVERFLSDMLGYAWNEADRLARSFEHDLPQEVEDRIFVALHRPVTCPHGFPIPEPEMIDIPIMPPLYTLEPGDHAVVALPGSIDPAVVEFLDTLGLRPGVQVEIKEKHPVRWPARADRRRAGSHARGHGRPPGLRGRRRPSCSDGCVCDYWPTATGRRSSPRRMIRPFHCGSPSSSARGNAAHEGSDRHLALQAGQRGTKAVVHATAERHVLTSNRSPEVECLGIGTELVGIAVGRAEPGQDELTRVDGLAARSPSA